MAGILEELMSDKIRVQIISEPRMVHALKNNSSAQVRLSDHELPESDLNFGLAEVAALVALAASIAELAELLVKVYNEINNDEIEVTLKTAKGTMTVKSKDAREVDAVLRQFQHIT